MRKVRMLRRRTFLIGGATTPAAVAAQPDTGLLAAAKREGTVHFYTSLDRHVAEQVGDALWRRYPEIRVRIDRSGAEHIQQQIEREQGRAVHLADVVENSDVASFLAWKQRGWLAQFVPDDVGRGWPAEQRDPDGRFATVRAHLAVIGYNTREVKAEEAPRGFKDLLASKWRGRLVKAHPSYSGTVLVATDELIKALGWGYLEQLAKQHVLRVLSATEAPVKVAQGEGAVMVDGVEYKALVLREAGNPIEVVYPEEGSPLVCGSAAVLETAPHPNAARVFANFLFSAECQQLLSDAGLRSFHAGIRLKPGRKPLSEIKLLLPDPEAIAKSAEEIKKRYSALFGP